MRTLQSTSTTLSHTLRLVLAILITSSCKEPSSFQVAPAEPSTDISVHPVCPSTIPAAAKLPPAAPKTAAPVDPLTSQRRFVSTLAGLFGLVVDALLVSDLTSDHDHRVLQEIQVF